ncbi:hypothetical protein V6N11_065489 [Hibiscus sabdariffa]|uniref:RNase H type-1 domain-containing protein n=1 Tax=Hibiscus sabdariffa TaxID=183260 RepID=A0ABR2PHF9_9ROSI
MLGTLDKVIPQDGSADSDSLTASDNSTIELLPGLDMIFKELLQEDGFKRFNWEHPLIKKVSGRLYDEYSNEFLDSIFAATLVVVSDSCISRRVHFKRQQLQQLHLSNLSDPNSCDSKTEKIMLAELIALEKAELQFYKQKTNVEDFDAMSAEMIKFFSDLIGTVDTSVRECSTSFIREEDDDNFITVLSPERISGNKLTDSGEDLTGTRRLVQKTKKPLQAKTMRRSRARSKVGNRNSKAKVESFGSWLSRFQKAIGVLQPLQAELWALLIGLRFAWDQGFIFVQIQSDCAEAVKLIKADNAYMSLISLVRAIAALRQKAWATEITWIPRTSNLPAEMLAKSIDPSKSKPVATSIRGFESHPKPFISSINLELLGKFRPYDKLVAVKNPAVHFSSQIDRYNRFGSVGCGNLDFVSRNIQTDPVLGSCLQRRDNSMKQTVGGRSTAGNIGQGLQAPPSDNMFTLLAPAGRQVQEIQLATSLDQVQPK